MFLKEKTVEQYKEKSTFLAMKIVVCVLTSSVSCLYVGCLLLMKYNL